MKFKEVKTFLHGLITAVEDHAIPFGAASNSRNWITKGDKIELRRGYVAIGPREGEELISNGNFSNAGDFWELQGDYDVDDFEWQANDDGIQHVHE